MSSSAFKTPTRLMIVALFLFIDTCFAVVNTVEITEATLRSYYQETPTIDKINAKLMDAKISLSEYQVDEKYTTSI